MGGAALIKDASPPSYLEQVDLENYNVNETIYAEIDAFIFQFLVGNQSLAINEQMINELIYASYEGFKKESTQYEISGGEPLYLNGVWIKFDNNQLTTYALFDYRGVSTTMTLSIDIDSTDDNLKMSLNTFKVGQLPVPKVLFSYLLDSFGSVIKEEYTYGEVNFEELYVTVLKEYIQAEIDINLKSDMILFNTLELQDGEFIINCSLNPENTDAVALQNTIDEFKSIIVEDTLVNNITDTLDLTNPTEQAFKDDLDDFTDLLKLKLETQDTSGLTDDEVELFNSLQQNFQSIDGNTQQDIVNALEGSIDPEVIAEINVALQNLDIEGFNGISDLFLGSN